MIEPRILARVRNVPSRLFAAMLTFGMLIIVPACLGTCGGIATSFDEGIGAFLILGAVLVFIGGVVVAWILIFSARTRVKRAEALLYQGDFEAATRDAHFVIRAVFRADYQMGALFTLALSAERLGAFPEAAALFARALAMIPTMAAQRPGRRARALLASHAAIDFAAAGDLPRASEMLARAHRELGTTGQPGALEGLLDDSYMGAIGINSMLVELENKREPRPLAVLAGLFLAFKHGQLPEVLRLAAHEQPTIDYGLAPHERALAERIRAEAMRMTSGGGPHRSGAYAPPTTNATSWAEMALP